MSSILLAVLTGLRLFNPGDANVAVRVTCDGTAAVHQLAPHAVEDVDGSACAATSAKPLLVFETGADDGVEWQRAIGPNDAECPATIPLLLPLNGCRFGSAVAAVNPVPGASYAWSLEGGEFLSGLGSDRVTIALGEGDTARVSVSVSTAHCTSVASGVIALHDAFTVKNFSAGSGLMGQQRTITWDYANGAPASQVLSGTDFSPVTLPNEARSYSYTPASEGDKNVTLQARSGGLPPAGRTRAAGRGTAAASDCNVASARAQYHVDCSFPDATILVPASVGADTPFTARVRLAPFATAKWTIANGTPTTATGESVTIKANGNAPVDINVVVTAGGCASNASARVALEATPCDNPTVEVVLIPRADCSTAAQARFTGKPPFRGTWNDGTPFLSSNFTADRTVTAPGSYSIAHFQDALCAGAASNTVTAATAVRASAVLTAPNGSCASGGQVNATLTGTPPFNGTWSDGQAFTTSSKQLTRSVAQGGPISLQLSDATCGPVTSNQLYFNDPGTVTVTLDPNSTAPGCQPIGKVVKVTATIANALPPYTVNWADGLTQTLAINASPIIVRDITIPPSGLTAGVVSAHDSICNLKIATPPVVIKALPDARFSVNSAGCPAQISTATLFYTPVAGASIAWNLSSGTITSGQGTTSIKFFPGSGDATLSCSIATPQGCSATISTTITGYPPPAVPQPVVTQGSTVAVGTPVTIAWTIDKSVINSTIDASTFGNQPTAPQCSGSLCSASYTPHQIGSVTFTVHLYGRCGEVVNGTTKLTVQ